jgi:hypothetical protein
MDEENYVDRSFCNSYLPETTVRMIKYSNMAHMSEMSYEKMIIVGKF